MATINGLQFHAAQVLTNEDSSVTTWRSLYLGPTKVATLLFERNVPECDDSVQVFMQYPYSEEKLRTLLAQLHPEQPNYGPETLANELEWLVSLEQEYMRHAGGTTGGMLALNLEGGQVTLGIPRRLGQASEEEILESCGPKLKEYEGYYGELKGYLIFHTPDDFNRGRALTLEELTR